MKILHVVTRSEPGGAQSFIRDLAECFVARGHDAAVAAGPEGEWRAFSGMDERVRRFEMPDLVRAISPARDFSALFALRKLYGAWKPDIVHLHTSKAAALGRVAGVVPRNRIVYTMHGYDQLRVANRRFLAIDKALIARTGAVVAVSCEDRGAMATDGYVPALIVNGTSDVLKKEPKDPALAARFEELRRAGRPLALAIARDSPPKRIDLVRRLAETLGGAAEFAWIGGEARPDDPGHFHALGETPEASPYLRYADFFVLLSDHEGLPMSLLEAMSCGLPSIVSDVGGMREALSASGRPSGDAETEAACGFAVKDIAEAAEAAERLAGDAALRGRMGAAARQIWESRYSIEQSADSYLKLYTALL